MCGEKSSEENEIVKSKNIVYQLREVQIWEINVTMACQMSVKSEFLKHVSCMILVE